MIVDPRILPVAGLGALLSLDRRVAFQTLVSHPVVAALAVGLLLGEPAVGLAVGVLLGLLWSRAIPVGGVVPPDETFAAVLATGVAVLGAKAAGASLAAAAGAGALVGVPAAQVGRRVELGLRALNGEMAAKVEKAVATGDLGVVERTTFKALLAAALAFFLLHLVALAIVTPAVTTLFARVPAVGPVLAAAVLPFPLAGLGGVISGAGFRLGLAWATLGFVVGLVLAEVLS